MFIQKMAALLKQSESEGLIKNWSNFLLESVFLISGVSEAL
jgi:hypothetical protein